MFLLKVCLCVVLYQICASMATRFEMNEFRIKLWVCFSASGELLLYKSAENKKIRSSNHREDYMYCTWPYYNLLLTFPKALPSKLTSRWWIYDWPCPYLLIGDRALILVPSNCLPVLYCRPFPPPLQTFPPMEDLQWYWKTIADLPPLQIFPRYHFNRYRFYFYIFILIVAILWKNTRHLHNWIYYIYHETSNIACTIIFY